MLMLDRSKEISRHDLATIQTPDATASWKPIAHKAVADTLVNRAEARGLAVRSERWSVYGGALYPAPGEKVELHGARLFGSIDFAPIPGIELPRGTTPSAAVRNSHDKTFALSVLSGARILICANGLLSAEHIVSRKHTSGIDLNAAIDRALDAFLESIAGIGALHQELRSRRLSPAKAHSLAVQCAKAGAFSSAQILPVIDCFENPLHEEFREPTAWSFYNSVTEIMKSQSAARQTDGFRALNSVLLAA